MPMQVRQQDKGLSSFSLLCVEGSDARKKYVSKNLRSCVRQFNLGATARIATLVEEFHDGGVATA